ncbi:DUF3592 domain-containing protein [Altererythrobacter sp.]|uniref:DUF3592 domain-containing protein n=1 Tax=Altererythrobacter sp. TaxID=1872480 RepID=UPI001B05C578|nr:DUF3592 domain-containing protein [Altererythrobacter sp.]MBO6608462.1 DUF3592 domain-containing protein [Altererythrobacter sp.]
MLKAVRNVGIFFLVIGLIPASIGGWKLVSNYQLAVEGSQATGTVIRLKRTIRQHKRPRGRDLPVIEFRNASGAKHIFTGAPGLGDHDYARGQRVRVIYSPRSPSDARVNSFGSLYHFSIWTLGFGLLFAGVGVASMGYYRRRLRVIDELMRNGLRVQAEFQHCIRDKRAKKGKDSPFYVFAQARNPSTGEIARFKSLPIWKDLSPVLRGQTVPVRFDPSSPKHYFVDLSQWISEDEFA